MLSEFGYPVSQDERVTYLVWGIGDEDIVWRQVHLDAIPEQYVKLLLFWRALHTLMSSWC
jgi:hypothetical protein